LYTASHENSSPNGLEGNSSQEGVADVYGLTLAGSAKTELQHRLDICIAGRWMYEQATT